MWRKLAIGLAAAAAVVAVVLVATQFGGESGWVLAAIAVIGLGMSLAGLRWRGDNGKVVGELGRSLLVAGLVSFAVWRIGDLQREEEERNSLRLTLGMQRQLVGVNLREEDMSRFDLAGKDLSRAVLAKANLSGANLRGAKLFRVNLKKAALAGADLSGASLSGAHMEGACLAGASLAGAHLPDAQLEDAALSGVDLEGTVFWYDLRATDLAGVGLNGARHADSAQWPPDFANRYPRLIRGSFPARPAPPAVPGEAVPAKLVVVFDGDTLVLSVAMSRREAQAQGLTTIPGVGGAEGRPLQIPVRLIGVDAPDLDEPGGIEAREFLRRILPEGSPVLFVTDRRPQDKFDRNLLYVFAADGSLVNQAMLERGLAIAGVDPEDDRNGNRRFAAQLLDTEVWARDRAIGLWRSCP